MLKGSTTFTGRHSDSIFTHAWIYYGHITMDRPHAMLYYAAKAKKYLSIQEAFQIVHLV